MIDEQIIEYDYETRVVDVERQTYDDVENILRPKSMEGYVGQEKVKDNLTVFMHAAKLRIFNRLESQIQISFQFWEQGCKIRYSLP